MIAHRKPLIVGSGNVRMRDDGVGIHVVRALRSEPPPDVTLLDVGSDIFAALPYLELTDQVLLINAIRYGRAPGSLCVFDGYEVTGQMHVPLGFEIAFPELLQSLAPGTRPRQFYVLGIEPSEVAHGSKLSPIVQATLPSAVRAARRLVGRWSEAELWYPDTEVAS